MRAKKLTKQEIETIIHNSESLRNLKNIDSVFAREGVFYDLKGDAFIRLTVNQIVANSIWECMDIPKNGVNNGYSDMMKCDKISLDIDIIKLGGIFTSNKYHSKLSFHYKSNDKGMKIDVGALVTVNIPRIMTRIKDIIYNNIPWFDNSEEALNNIDKEKV